MNCECTVQTVDGVTIVRSQALPLQMMADFYKSMPKGADHDVAMGSRIGAVLVLGMPQALRAFRLAHPPASPTVLGQIAQARALYAGVRADELVAYLDGYDRGQSADALCQASTGIDCASSPGAHPHDDDDLGRCLRLYGASAVVRENFAKVATLGPVWAGLVKNWPSPCVAPRATNPARAL